MSYEELQQLCNDASQENNCVDPYWIWAVLAGKAETKDGEQIPCLVERRTGDGRVRFGTEYVHVENGSLSFSEPDKLERWQVGIPRNPVTFVPSSFPGTKEREREQVAAIAAVLDDGCPFLNTAFQGRVRWLWHQGKLGAGRPTGSGISANGTEVAGSIRQVWFQPYEVDSTDAYGAELAPDQIDDMEQQARRGTGTIDEHALYKAIGYLEVAEKRTHGASIVSQVLSKDEKPSDDEDMWPLIFVQFPQRDVSDTSGGWLGVRVYDGLNYILSRARQGFTNKKVPNDPVPIVTTLAYGGLAGAHDGTSLLEEALDDLQGRNPHLTLMLAAGNAYGRGIHAATHLGAKAQQVIDIFIPPDNQNTVFVELWFRGVHAEDVPEQTEFTLRSPSNTQSKTQKASGVSRADDGAFIIVCAMNVPQGRDGRMALLAIAPTRVGAGPRAEAGVWQIEVSNRSDQSLQVDAWIERDDIAGAAGRVQQARFTGDFVCERATLTNIANGVHTRRFVVGAVVGSDDSVADYSASGPAIGGESARIGPDLSAVADDARSLRGVRCEGVRSGERYRASGTSVAAAVAANAELCKIVSDSSTRVHSAFTARSERKGVRVR